MIRWATVESMLGQHCNVHLKGQAVIVNVLVSKPTKKQYTGNARAIILTSPGCFLIVPLSAIESIDKLPEWIGKE